MLHKLKDMFMPEALFAALGALMYSILAPVVDWMMFLGILVAFDTFTGSWAAWKKDGWSGVTSKRGLRGLVPKIILYSMAVVSCSGVAHFYPSTHAVEIGTAGIMFWEVKSIFENMEKILGIGLISITMKIFTKGRKGVQEMMKHKTIDNDQAAH